MKLHAVESHAKLAGRVVLGWDTPSAMELLPGISQKPQEALAPMDSLCSQAIWIGHWWDGWGFACLALCLASDPHKLILSQPCRSLVPDSIGLAQTHAVSCELTQIHLVSLRFAQSHSDPPNLTQIEDLLRSAWSHSDLSRFMQPHSDLPSFMQFPPDSLRLTKVHPVSSRFIENHSDSSDFFGHT